MTRGQMFKLAMLSKAKGYRLDEKFYAYWKDGISLKEAIKATSRKFPNIYIYFKDKKETGQQWGRLTVYWRFPTSKTEHRWTFNNISYEDKAGV